MRNIIIAASKADSGKTMTAAGVCHVATAAGHGLRVMELEEQPRLCRRVATEVEFFPLDAAKGEEDAEFKHLDPIVDAMGAIDRPTLIDTAGGQLTPILNHIMNHRLERTAKHGDNLVIVLPLTIQDDSRSTVISNLPVIRRVLPKARLCIIRNEVKGKFHRLGQPRWPELELALATAQKSSAGAIEIISMPGIDLAPKVSDAISAAPLSEAFKLMELENLAQLGLVNSAADRQAAEVEAFLEMLTGVAHAILQLAGWPITKAAAE